MAGMRIRLRRELARVAAMALVLGKRGRRGSEEQE
jgi:hypothetical protein